MVAILRGVREQVGSVCDGWGSAWWWVGMWECVGRGGGGYVCVCREGVVVVCGSVREKAVVGMWSVCVGIKGVRASLYK